MVLTIHIFSIKLISALMLSKYICIAPMAVNTLLAFFEMKLATNDPIDVNNMSRDQWSTFLHEYIHFLQDVTTTYGLYHIYAVLKRHLMVHVPSL